MQDYLLVIKGSDLNTSSPEEMQKALQDYLNWAGNLADQYKDGQRLENQGALVYNSGQVITDGPFLESKEMISGYVMIQASSLEEAIGIAKGSPLLEHCHIEVRPIKQMPD